MEHRIFVPAFGALAAALTSVWISPQASAGEPSGIRNEDDGWANIEIIAQREGDRRSEDGEFDRPDGPRKLLARWLRHDRSTTGAAATLRRVHLELDGNGKAFAPGGCNVRTHGDSASGPDAKGQAQTSGAGAARAAVLVAVALAAALSAKVLTAGELANDSPVIKSYAG